MPGMRPISSDSARPQPAAAQRSSPVQISAGAALASDRLFVLSYGRRKKFKSERCEMRLFQIARAIISSSAVAGCLSLAGALSWCLRLPLLLNAWRILFFFLPYSSQASNASVWCGVWTVVATQQPLSSFPSPSKLSFFFLARSDDGEASEPST